ncbi:MAG TPA: M20 family metallo-hydrolase [Marinilabiliaceae bacterium]|nr:M20 family metallo-hydrolase [Marinilabiliaceae bacterium]
MVNNLINDSIDLLKKLIAIPSLSKEEKAVADFLEETLMNMGLEPKRMLNNIWVTAPNYQSDRPTLLLNSHIDTVKPSKNWSSDPFTPLEKDGKIIGLGSNDAGAPLVSLLAVFRYLSQKEQNYNLIYAATAEEEISGSNGIVALLPKLGEIDLGVVGEPTQMQMAVAEKGLMVIDGTVEGKAGHAARNEGVNAIYKALPILNFFQEYKFEKESDFLGPVKMTVTGVQAGSQHNVVPDQCTFMVDVRVNECYSNQEVFDILQSKVDCQLKARSFRLNSSSISQDHPIVKKGISLGLKPFGSPTLSDQALMKFTTIKIGPGDSARSHTTDEFIFIQEIKEGVEKYIKLLDGLQITK